MSRALRGMAREISHRLVGQMATRSTAERPIAKGVVELLVQRLAEEVANQLLEDSSEIAPREELGTRVADLELPSCLKNRKLYIFYIDFFLKQRYLIVLPDTRRYHPRHTFRFFFLETTGNHVLNRSCEPHVLLRNNYM